MHVLLEGSIPYTMKAMLQSFVTVKKYFTINYVNEKILCFRFSRNDCRSKPSQLSSNILDEGNFHQSGICVYMYTSSRVHNRLWTLDIMYVCLYVYVFVCMYVHMYALEMQQYIDTFPYHDTLDNNIVLIDTHLSYIDISNISMYQHQKLAYT